MNRRKWLQVFILISSLTACSVSQTSNADETQEKEAIAWFEKKEWLNGLALTPHESIDKQEFYKEYTSHKQWWDKAFAYIKNTDLASLTPGDHQIEGQDVFARVTEAPLKDVDSARWEAHRDYTDIHLMITGIEKIGIGSLSAATTIVPYDSKRDIAFYTGTGEDYVGNPQTLFIAFPKHIHRPAVEVDGKKIVKKLVIKVRR